MKFNLIKRDCIFCDFSDHELQLIVDNVFIHLDKLKTLIFTLSELNYDNNCKLSVSEIKKLIHTIIDFALIFVRLNDIERAIAILNNLEEIMNSLYMIFIDDYQSSFYEEIINFLFYKSYFLILLSNNDLALINLNAGIDIIKNFLTELSKDEVYNDYILGFNNLKLYIFYDEKHYEEALDICIKRKTLIKPNMKDFNLKKWDNLFMIAEYYIRLNNFIEAYWYLIELKELIELLSKNEKNNDDITEYLIIIDFRLSFLKEIIYSD